jgi:short-subunit dehydrogenase
MPPERPLAVVTGASSGIGRCFADQLAASGHDLVLVARSRDRLEALADELRRRDGIEVRVVVADLGEPGPLTELAGSLRARVPDLLVNNAGFGTFGPFHQLDLAREEELLRVNVHALVRLTHACLPGMLERGSGAVINVSSLAGEVPSGYNATYGASKAFVTSFSQALYEELRGTPVTVQCLLPGLTDTAWAETAGIDISNTPRLVISDPADVVRASLAALRRGSAVCVPGAASRVLAFVQRVSPRSLMRRATAGAARGALARRPR